MAIDALKGKKLGGTNIKEDQFKKNEVLYSMFTPQLEYAWDNGIAIGLYLEGLKQGKILGSYCEKCNKVVLPPRSFCELCWKPSDEWVELKDTGTVQTFSVSRINWDASRRGKDEKPLIPAVISIDGASEKVGMMHMLDEVEVEDLDIGMKVEAVWKKEEDRTGAITDIQYFRPIKAAKKKAKKK